MISKEEFSKIVSDLKEKLDETNAALISDELISLESAFSSAYDEKEEVEKDIEKLKNEKDELIKVNGKLYQRIGFEDKEEVKEETKDEEDEIKIEDVINEKGEMI